VLRRLPRVRSSHWGRHSPHEVPSSNTRPCLSWNGAHQFKKAVEQRRFIDSISTGGNEEPSRDGEEHTVLQEWMKNTILQEWLKNTDQILSIPLLSDTVVSDAVALVQNLIMYPHLARNEACIDQMFRVLDRFCVDSCRLRCPLQDDLLFGTMNAWSACIKSLNAPAPSDSSSTGNMDQNSSASSNIRTLPDHLIPAAIFRKLQDYFNAGLFRYNSQLDNIVLNATKDVHDPRTAAYEANSIYQYLVSRPNQYPEESTIYRIVNMWSNSGLPEAARVAEDHFQELKRQSAQSGLEVHEPSANLFCAVMEAYARSSKSSFAVNRMIDLFQEMKQANKGITKESFGRVCAAFATCRHPNSPDHARAVLVELCDAYFLGKIVSQKPTQHIFSAVIAAFGRAGRADEAAEIFHFMENISLEKSAPSFRPNGPCHNALIWAYAQAGRAEEAEALLPGVLSMLEEDELDRYEEDSLAGVLVAWARSGDSGAHQKLAQVIQRLRNYKRQRNLALTSYNAMLTCYARQENALLGARVAEDLVRWMNEQDDVSIKPNAQSYLNVVTAWKNAGFPERSENNLRRFLKMIEEEGKERKLIDIQLFNIAIAAWANSDRPKAVNRAHSIFRKMAKYELWPDTVSYNSLMLAYARSSNPNLDSISEVDNLLKEMVKRYSEGDLSARPDEYTYSTVLLNYSRSSDPRAMKLADEAVVEMEESGIRRNSAMYNTLMIGWSRQNNVNRAEALFQEMLNGFKAGDISLKPHYPAYITRLRAWVNAGNPEMAVRVLNEIIDCADSGLLDQFPATREINCLLEAWLRSNDKLAAEKADVVLHSVFRDILGDHELDRNLGDAGTRILEQDLNKARGLEAFPDVYSFTLVLSAYADSSSTMAGERAYFLFNKLKDLAAGGRESLKPSVVTYFEVIGALCSNLNVRTKALVLELIHELQLKDKSFWDDDGNGLLAREKAIFPRLRRKVGESDFPDRGEILTELEGFDFRKKYTNKKKKS